MGLGKVRSLLWSQQIVVSFDLQDPSILADFTNHSVVGVSRIL